MPIIFVLEISISRPRGNICGPEIITSLVQIDVVCYLWRRDDIFAYDGPYGPP